MHSGARRSVFRVYLRADHGSMHVPRHKRVELLADTQQGPGAYDFQNRLKAIERDGQHSKSDQGRKTLARDHSVIDLQHEKRCRQGQKVDHRTDQRDAEASSLEGGGCRRDRRSRRPLSNGLYHQEMRLMPPKRRR